MPLGTAEVPVGVAVMKLWDAWLVVTAGALVVAKLDDAEDLDVTITEDDAEVATSVLDESVLSVGWARLELALLVGPVRAEEGVMAAVDDLEAEVRDVELSTCALEEVCTTEVEVPPIALSVPEGKEIVTKDGSGAAVFLVVLEELLVRLVTEDAELCGADVGVTLVGTPGADEGAIIVVKDPPALDGPTLVLELPYAEVDVYAGELWRGAEELALGVGQSVSSVG